MFYEKFQEIYENSFKELNNIEKKNKLNKLEENIKNNNYYYNEVEKQLLYPELLKEYNFLKNDIRVKTIKPDLLKKVIQIYIMKNV